MSDLLLLMQYSNKQKTKWECLGIGTISLKKKVPWNGRRVSCVGLFISHSLGFQWDWVPGSGQAVPGLWFSFSALVDVDVCFWSLTCWNVKFLFIFSCFRGHFGYFGIFSWYLELFIFPSILRNAAGPTEGKQPQRIMPPPPCFTVCMEFVGWCSVFALCWTPLLEFRLKCSIFVSSDHNIFL